jgi:hypothetical protein
MKPYKEKSPHWCNPPVAGFSHRRILNLSQGNAICQEGNARKWQQDTRQDDDIRKINGIRFNGMNLEDLRKRLVCQ